MSFEEVLGQATAVRALRRALVSGRLASGYLFFGPEGVGKGLTARAFARAVLCPEGEERGDACGACRSCARSASGGHRGLLEVTVPEDRTRILLRQVHLLSEQLSLRPADGDRTVAVLDPADLIQEEGYNALLKTLEEPPRGTSIVLVVANRESVPETVRSRCQSVRFRPLPREVVSDLLRRGHEVEPRAADRLAELSDGSMGRAVRLLAMRVHERIGEIEGLLADPAAEPLAVARAFLELAADRVAQERRSRAADLLRLLLELARSRLLAERGRVPEARICCECLIEGLNNLSLNVDTERVLQATFVRLLEPWTKALAT